MEEERVKGVKTMSIWWILVGITMLALLFLSAEVAPSFARAEEEPALYLASDLEVADISPALEEPVTAQAISEEEDASEESLEDAEMREKLEKAATIFVNLLEDAVLFDLHNANALLVSMAHYFSGYLGQFVFFGNWSNGRSGSFGVFMGLHDRNKNDTEVLKHEHGHFLQYKELGLLKYIFAIAIPSLTHDPADYYSQPWEVTADLFGGVTTHRHSPGSEEAGIKYLNDAKNANLFSLISACFA